MTYRIKRGRAGLVVLAIIGMAAGLVLVSAIPIMILWGALGLTLGFQTIGYGTAVLVSLSLGVVGSYFKDYQ